MLSFESSSAPESKLFILGALAGAAKAGIAKAGIAKAGLAKAGAIKTGLVKAGASIAKTPIKSIGGLTISPSFQKNDSKTYDNSTNSTVIYNS